MIMGSIPKVQLEVWKGLLSDDVHPDERNQSI